MQFRTTGLLLLGAMALPASGTAQTTPAAPAITRTVVAATKLATVTDVPLYFKAVSVTLQPEQMSGISPVSGILYQMSGSTQVALDGEAKRLNAGEGLFIAGGKTAALRAGGNGPSTFLHFLLAPAGDLDRSAETTSVAVRELYRTADPIPDLKPGGYDLNLTRVTFPAGMPSNPPHHRSGAALYFIIYAAEPCGGHCASAPWLIGPSRDVLSVMAGLCPGHPRLSCLSAASLLKC